MFFISLKKCFSFSRYSNFCNFSPSFPQFPDLEGQMEVEYIMMYLENQKSFLDEIKNIFKFLNGYHLVKNKNLIKKQQTQALIFTIFSTSWKQKYASFMDHMGTQNALQTLSSLTDQLKASYLQHCMKVLELTEK